MPWDAGRGMPWDAGRGMPWDVRHDRADDLTLGRLGFGGGHQRREDVAERVQQKGRPRRLKVACKARDVTVVLRLAEVGDPGSEASRLQPARPDVVGGAAEHPPLVHQELAPCVEGERRGAHRKAGERLVPLEPPLLELRPHLRLPSQQHPILGRARAHRQSPLDDPLTMLRQSAYMVPPRDTDLDHRLLSPSLRRLPREDLRPLPRPLLRARELEPGVKDGGGRAMHHSPRALAQDDRALLERLPDVVAPRNEAVAHDPVLHPPHRRRHRPLLPVHLAYHPAPRAKRLCKEPSHPPRGGAAYRVVLLLKQGLPGRHRRAKAAPLPLSEHAVLLVGLLPLDDRRRLRLLLLNAAHVA